MSSRQRRNGQVAQIWYSHSITDARGNVQRAVDLNDTPVETKVAVIPQRSARAEVPGQLAINVIAIIGGEPVGQLDLWSRVRLNGVDFDVVTPPAYHHGNRAVRHWSCDLRQRP